MRESGTASNRKYIQFEHHAYIEKGIPALTVSASTPRDLVHRYQKYSVFDRSLQSAENLRRNILILSEAVMKMVYNF